MSFLGSLVGRIEQGAQGAEHAISNAVHGGQPAPASTASPQQTSNAVNNINKATGFSPSRFVPDYSGAYPAQGFPVQPANAPDLNMMPGYGNPLEQVFGGGGSLGLQGQTPINLQPNGGYVPNIADPTQLQGGNSQDLMLRGILNR